MNTLSDLEDRARAGLPVDPAEFARARAAADLDVLAGPAREREETLRVERASELARVLATATAAHESRRRELEQRARELIIAVAAFARVVLDDDIEAREYRATANQLGAGIHPPASAMTLLGDLGGWLEEAVHLGLLAGGLDASQMPKTIQADRRTNSTVPRIKQESSPHRRKVSTVPRIGS